MLFARKRMEEGFERSEWGIKMRVKGFYLGILRGNYGRIWEMEFGWWWPWWHGMTRGQHAPLSAGGAWGLAGQSFTQTWNMVPVDQCMGAQSGMISRMRGGGAVEGG